MDARRRGAGCESPAGDRPAAAGGDLARPGARRLPGGQGGVAERGGAGAVRDLGRLRAVEARDPEGARADRRDRSEEHTSELQSRLHLVCRLLLEKKKKNASTLCTSVLLY